MTVAAMSAIAKDVSLRVIRRTFHLSPASIAGCSTQARAEPDRIARNRAKFHARD
jgi:hypothetical protein